MGEANRSVILVRHADIDGPAQDGTELNDAGIARREELRRVLGDAGIGAILTSTVVRSRQTAECIAQHLNLTPQPVVGAHQSAAPMVAAVRGLPVSIAAVLVVGHSHTLGDIIEGLGGPPIDAIAGGAFDHLFVLAGGGLVHLRYGASLPSQ